MSYYNPPMANYKDEPDYSFGNINNQGSYSLHHTSNFSNIVENPAPLNYSTDPTLTNFDLGYLNENQQTLSYPYDQNKPLFPNDLDNSFNSSSLSISDYTKSLPLANINNLYTEHSTLQTPYYDPISKIDSPHDQLVPNVAAPDYHLSYDTASSMGSFMNDTTSPSPSSMTTAQLVMKVYGGTSEKQSPQERVPIVWHFLLRLLANPEYNPSIICWDNIGTHTFRLINPDAVASRWGERLGKPNLTRNNFARTLRYHYSNGALKKMSEQHVYQLGQKAIDYLQEKARYCK
ncbi:unnamed protein product [Meganyctiphanes norvegica]|uniref:ETS domain-containing protein n=1 Tax=Meganyctiphanes norvegica TaxID=48144 RepID=A0AAV2PRY1_MEGNR